MNEKEIKLKEHEAFLLRVALINYIDLFEKDVNRHEFSYENCIKELKALLDKLK